MANKRKIETFDEMKIAVYRQANADDRPTITAMPIRLIQAQTTFLRRVSQDGEVFTQRLSTKRSRKGSEPGPNPWELRAAFDRVRLPAECASFLRMCGRFKLDRDEQSVSWLEFQKWQGWLREHAKGEPFTYWDGWPEGISQESLEKIQVRPDIQVWPSQHLKAPYMVIHCDTALETVAATIFIDHWNGVDYGKCGWCGSLYRITNLHKRGYCTTAHTRLALKTAARKRAKEEGLSANGKGESNAAV